MVINNRQALEKLEAEIVAEYWQGYGMARLQERTEEKMAERGIVAPKPAAFAELTMYKTLTGRRKAPEPPKPWPLAIGAQMEAQ